MRHSPLARDCGGVEHAIGGYKRFKAASDIYRNKLANMDDQMNLVCAGLWNWHLEQTV